jgi:hypothetical protein
MKRYEPNQQKTTDKFNKTNKRVYGTIIYPKIERHETDIYIDVISEDRVDNLAYQYYGDVTLWWIMAINLIELLNMVLLLDKKVV